MYNWCAIDQTTGYEVDEEKKDAFEGSVYLIAYNKEGQVIKTTCGCIDPDQNEGVKHLHGVVKYQEER